MAKRFRINLLRKEGDSFITNVYNVFSTYTRYVIILVQILVLLVFFVKIFLDQTIIDLKDEIDQKNQIILTAESMITQTNLMHDKLQAIDEILADSDAHYLALNQLLKNIPKSVILNRLDLKNKQIIASGKTLVPNDLKKMQLKLNNLTGKKVELYSLVKQNLYYNFEMIIYL